MGSEICIRDRLLGWRAPDETREQLRRGFLAALASDPMTVAKDGPPAHLTASCLVLSPDGTHVLLHLHRRAELWLQFGGHLEPGDPGVWAAAAREAREESGLVELVPDADPIDVDRHQLSGRFEGCTEHLDVRFLAVADVTDLPQATAESLDIPWFPIDALPPNTPTDLGRLIALGRGRLAR